MTSWITVCCVIQTIMAVSTIYSPALTWDVCSPSRIVVTLTGAEEGGIIYIRGYGATCRQTTAANGTQHVFDFQACGIVTGETYFTIIVQKSPLYQTGSDLQESLLCIYDLSDITVGASANTGGKEDDAGINKTVKPTGNMMLYKDGIDIGGQNAKLSDMITMTIQLDAEYIDDFDIKVKSCTANFIELIITYCSADTALFPNFLHATQGIITSTFGAFRTTDLGGGYVQMIFSCTVEVCRGPCTPESCSNGEEGWGRKRRQTKTDVKYDELSIGASFSVGTDREEQNDAKDSMDQLCIDNVVFILLLLAILGVLMTSLCLTVHVTTRLSKRNDELRNLTGINNRQRKSLIHVVKDRRKSSISIIPRQLDLTMGSATRRQSGLLAATKTHSIDLPNTSVNTRAEANGTPKPSSIQDNGPNTTLSTKAEGMSSQSTTREKNALASRHAEQDESRDCPTSPNTLQISKDASMRAHATTPNASQISKDALRTHATTQNIPSTPNQISNGSISTLGIPQSKLHDHDTLNPVSTVSNKPGTMTTKSGQLESRSCSLVDMEKLLGLDSQQLKGMSTEEKKLKMLECQTLLKRLTQQQM